MTTNNDEFRILSLKLLNYRQYYGEQKVNFSSRDEGITVFLGENGEGKSNLLNAINWCLFRNEPHKSKDAGMPIINTRYLSELGDGAHAEMQVQVELEKGQTRYRISRYLKGINHHLQKQKIGNKEIVLIDENRRDPVPAGFQTLEEDSKAEFLKTDQSGQLSNKGVAAFSVAVNELLPQKLAQFYLLDGEFLEKLFKRFEGVEQGIEQVSQLELLSNAAGHARDLAKIPKGRSNDVDLIQRDKDGLVNWLESKDEKGYLQKGSQEKYSLPTSSDEEDFHPISGEPRLKSLFEENKKISERLDQIHDELGNINSATVEVLEKTRDTLEKERMRLDASLNTETVIEMDHLISFGPQILLKDAIQKARETIAKEIELGRLPNKTTIIFTEHLLQKGECFCGTSLQGDPNPHKSKILEAQERAKKDYDLDAAVELRYDYELVLKNYDSNLLHIDENSTKVRNLEMALEETRKDLKANRIELSNAGDQRAVELAREEKALRSLKENNDVDVGSLKVEIENKKSKISELNREINSKLKKNVQLDKARIEFERWQSAYEKLEMIRDSLKEEIRKQVQEKTTDIFKTIMWKENFDSVLIDENYNLKLLDKSSYNVIGELSAGEKMFLALSFIGAIREITGYKFPLIIDTPLGRISGTPRILVAQKLPDFLPNSQISLLATDTEYTSKIDPLKMNAPERRFCEWLKDKTKTKEMRLEMDKSEELFYTTTITEYKPKYLVAN